MRSEKDAAATLAGRGGGGGRWGVFEGGERRDEGAQRCNRDESRDVSPRQVQSRPCVDAQWRFHSTARPLPHPCFLSGENTHTHTLPAPPLPSSDPHFSSLPDEEPSTHRCWGPLFCPGCRRRSLLARLPAASPWRCSAHSFHHLCGHVTPRTATI